MGGMGAMRDFQMRCSKKKTFLFGLRAVCLFGFMIQYPESPFFE